MKKITIVIYASEEQLKEGSGETFSSAQTKLRNDLQISVDNKEINGFEVKVEEVGDEVPNLRQ